MDMGEDRYLVVSDIHLGGDHIYLDKFCEFLEWIKNLPVEGITRTYICKNGTKVEITIKPPTKFILLGDILELWDPRGDDRNNIIKDALIPFSILMDIPCDKIYVLGNHDHRLAELIKIVNHLKRSKDPRFEIYSKHYPENEKTLYLPGNVIGHSSYFFLHGHLFDRWQPVRLGNWLGNHFGFGWQFDPVAFPQDICNISFVKRLFKLNASTFFYSLYILISSILYFNINYQPLKFMILIVLWPFIFVFSLAKVFTLTQAFIWRYIKPKDKIPEKIITDKGIMGRWKHYDNKKDVIDADVVVFGHTHVAGTYLLQKDWRDKKKLFINTGCWVNEKIDDINTFVYIDENGPYLLKWVGGVEPIKCVEFNPYSNK